MSFLSKKEKEKRLPTLLAQYNKAQLLISLSPISLSHCPQNKNILYFFNKDKNKNALKVDMTGKKNPEFWHKLIT